MVQIIIIEGSFGLIRRFLWLWKEYTGNILSDMLGSAQKEDASAHQDKPAFLLDNTNNEDTVSNEANDGSSLHNSATEATETLLTWERNAMIIQESADDCLIVDHDLLYMMIQSIIFILMGALIR